MRWLLEELFYELDVDPARKILFVEGNRDLAFWRDLVPDEERQDTVVYRADEVQVSAASGGERGRLMELAKSFIASRYSDRALFFVDADFDRMLNRTIEVNVVLTDFRDLEAYGLNQQCIARVCNTGFAKPASLASAILEFVQNVVRPIGVLRAVSETQDLKLPFSHTLERTSIGRWLNRPVEVLEIDKLLRTLLQNASISLEMLVGVISLHTEAMKSYAHLPLHDIVHGKDFIRSFAYKMNIGPEEAERLIFMAIGMQMETLRTMPNLSKVENWVRTPLSVGVASPAHV